MQCGLNYYNRDKESNFIPGIRKDQKREQASAKRL